ncbi:MAG TPA: DUF2226 domain-containing protein [Methanosarcinaceae archaeon]|nr:DUF2226 domain-containing protein [Methanosarcinaceae archaeon]
MKIPKGKFVKTYPERSEYRIVTEQLTSGKFNGYILISTPIEDIDAKGYLVFEGGVPVLAYYEHKDVLNCEHALKNIARNFLEFNSVVELHELTKHQIDICKMYVSCVNKPGSSIIALDIYDGVEPSPDSVDELSCEKAGGAMPKESMCNICKVQCISSIADPTHIIAKRFIKNESAVLNNRNLLNGRPTTSKVSEPVGTIEPEPSINVEGKTPEELSADDELEAFLKESVNSFKDQSSIILESLGLGHMKKQ